MAKPHPHEKEDSAHQGLRWGAGSQGQRCHQGLWNPCTESLNEGSGLWGDWVLGRMSGVVPSPLTCPWHRRGLGKKIPATWRPPSGQLYQNATPGQHPTGSSVCHLLCAKHCGIEGRAMDKTDAVLTSGHSQPWTTVVIANITMSDAHLSPFPMLSH